MAIGSSRDAPDPTAIPDLSVVVPTYRGADCLGELLERLREVARRRGLAHEVVVVNDGSPDRTWEILSKLAERHAELVAIDLLHNHGQALATMCGIAHARGRLVATMDDDLQQPPEELPKLLDALEDNEELDAVVGSWPRDQGILRNIGSAVHAVVDRVAYGTPRGFRHTSMRLMRRPVVDALKAHNTRTPVLGPLLRQVTANIANVPVEHVERSRGASGFRPIHGITTVFTNLFQASTLPLRLLSRLGLLAAAVAFLGGAIVLARWATGAEPPPGWLSSFLGVAFFGGTMLFGLGLLGEYVHLVMREVRQPPRWSIRSRIGPSR